MEAIKYSNYQTIGLVALRTVIGWHFAYEGIFKILKRGWTSKGYIESSEWIFSSFFQFIAAMPVLLRITDFFIVTSLLLIGVCLIIGICEKIAVLTGIFLLLMFYLAHPPIIGFSGDLGLQGNYLIINNNIIEIVAMLILLTFPIKTIGLSILFKLKN